MDIVTRKVGEAVVIGGIRVIILGVSGQQVRLGIHASKDGQTNPEETFENVQAGEPSDPNN
jgi:carbon storage regulator